MLNLFRFAQWFDSNYEKIWVVTCIIAIVLFAIGVVFNSEVIYGVSEDVSDFYDDILSE